MGMLGFLAPKAPIAVCTADNDCLTPPHLSTARPHRLCSPACKAYINWLILAASWPDLYHEAAASRRHKRAQAIYMADDGQAPPLYCKAPLALQWGSLYGTDHLDPSGLRKWKATAVSMQACFMLWPC